MVGLKTDRSQNSISFMMIINGYNVSRSFLSTSLIEPWDDDVIMQMVSELIPILMKYLYILLMIFTYTYVMIKIYITFITIKFANIRMFIMLNIRIKFVIHYNLMCIIYTLIHVLYGDNVIINGFNLLKLLLPMLIFAGNAKEFYVRNIPYHIDRIRNGLNDGCYDENDSDIDEHPIINPDLKQKQNQNNLNINKPNDNDIYNREDRLEYVDFDDQSRKPGAEYSIINLKNQIIFMEHIVNHPLIICNNIPQFFIIDTDLVNIYNTYAFIDFPFEINSQTPKYKISFCLDSRTPKCENDIPNNRKCNAFNNNGTTIDDSSIINNTSHIYLINIRMLRNLLIHMLIFAHNFKAFYTKI